MWRPGPFCPGPAPRWPPQGPPNPRHPPGKPSELLLRLKNIADTDRSIALSIDLYYQGRTVETFEADTCLRPGMMLMGKLNGIHFIPERLTTDQIKDGGAQVEVTRTDVTKAPCP